MIFLMILPNLNTGSNTDFVIIKCMDTKRKRSLIIAGGGVSGLMSARELSKQGYAVTILEATDRLGGRIHTIRNSLFTQPVERGVEFIHGNLPLTIGLLKESGIEYKPVRGNMIRIVDGDWKTQDDFTLGWDELMTKMNSVRQDMTMDEFLKENFSDEKYDALRTSVLRFANGFDLADTSRASVLALREEWMGEEDEQYRVPGGFDQLINFLEKECLRSGVVIHTTAPVAEIKWEKNDVTVITSNRKIFKATKVIVTVSLGVLQSGRSILFQPGIDNYFPAAKKIGFGTVIKVMLEFKEAFWEKKKKGMAFLFTNEIIPTWWTQSPSSYPMLTGWAGGPQAWTLENNDDETILDLALHSLSNVFQKAVDELRQMLVASAVANWKKDPYSTGAYSYDIVGSIEAKKLLNTPVGETIFFAGEAFYEGPSFGTVEAALVSAKDVVEKIVNSEW
jgi:monoamine oxidase